MKKCCFKKRVIIIILLFIIINVCAITSVEASQEDNIAQFDFDEVQDVIDENVENSDINFEELLLKVINNDELSFINIINIIIEGINNEIAANKNIFIKLILLGIIAAVFTKFADVFGNVYISKRSYDISFILIITVLLSSYSKAYGVANTAIESILAFVKVIIPIYTTAVILSTGSNSGFAFYESTLCIIMVVEWIILKILLPFTGIYVLIIIADNIVEESILSQLAGLIKKGLIYSQKILLTSTIGIQSIQKMVIPHTDGMKKKVISNTVNTIPVIGDTISSVSDTLAGSAILLKNVIGVAGIIVLIIICIIPLIKILIQTVILGISAAILQPIADKHLVNSISGMMDAVSMIIQIVTTSLLLFIISLAIIASV